MAPLSSIAVTTERVSIAGASGEALSIRGVMQGLAQAQPGYIEIPAKNQAASSSKKESLMRIDSVSGKTYRVVRPIDEIKAEVEWAPQKWQNIREDTSDIAKIASNTGIEKERIYEIKEHFFFASISYVMEISHNLIQMQKSQQPRDRLCHGDFIKNDIDLLEHEYFELLFEKTQRCDYDTAHAATINAGKIWNPPVFNE